MRRDQPREKLGKSMKTEGQASSGTLEGDLHAEELKEGYHV